MGFEELLTKTAQNRKLSPYLVGKDYWLSHALCSLQSMDGIKIVLKGGTSLSKGYGLIDRFSEDIDVKVSLEGEEDDEKSLFSQPLANMNDNKKKATIEKRKQYFNKLIKFLNSKIPDMVVEKDEVHVQDEKVRRIGVMLSYNQLFNTLGGIKDGVLL